MTAPSEKPPTMRSRVDLLVEQVGKLTDDLELRNSKPVNAASKPYTEADAIGACIRALDPIAEAERSNRGGNYSFPPVSHSNSAVGRALRYLAAKYGVELVEVRTEPCNRPHLDTLDVSRVMDAISSAVSS